MKLLRAHWLAILALCVALTAAGCGGSGHSTAEPAGSTGPVVELKGVEALRTRFDEDEGKARLLLLLSPT